MGIAFLTELYLQENRLIGENNMSLSRNSLIVIDSKELIEILYSTCQQTKNDEQTKGVVLYAYNIGLINLSDKVKRDIVRR